jgi:lysophospholipase L1-like esterase
VRPPKIAIVLIQAFLVIAVMAVCTWIGLSWLGTILVGTLVAIPLTASIPRRENGWATAFELAISWVCTTIAAIILLGRRTYWDNSDTATTSILASAIATSLTPAAWITSQSTRRRNWKIQIVFWCFFGALVFLCDAYLQNSPFKFYAALAINCALMICCKLWFCPPKPIVLAQNTAILFLIGLPIADLFVRPPVHSRINRQAEIPYHHCESVAHPGRVYECWSQFILAEWDRMRKAITVINRQLQGPSYRFRPGAKFRFAKSDIRINNLGYRGHDVTVSKGKAFRIVAIGESTTFGFTLNSGDRPWPDLLEEMIRIRLNLPSPVEVINAGFPASTIEDSLWRLDQDILILKPDMIISYHGINGFHLLDDAIPPLIDPNPPTYVDRPLKLLANLDYRWKVYQFNRHRMASLEEHPPAFQSVVESKYATDTRRLIELCKTNHIKLVVGNFSLAVNGSSEQEVTDFYHGFFQEVRWTIKANEAYARMLTALAHEESTIRLVDTHPGLDGYYTNFTDLMHLTQSGRQKIAEAFFAGIEETLRKQIQPKPETL